MQKQKIQWFALAGKLPKRVNWVLGIMGPILFVVAWQITASLHIFKNGIVPPPLHVLMSFPLLWDNDILGNAIYSMILNLLGYLEAAAIGLAFGALIGLEPIFRALTERCVAALRYLPLSAMLGPFMAFFGIRTNMKVQFLAFGLLIYVIPQVVQRIDEVEKTYLDLMKTIGASKWQMIKYVYWPAVSARIFSDFVVLSAISWTYIVIAEIVNATYGIGALSYHFYRQSKIEPMYATIIVIVLIGFAFDKIGKALDRKLFTWKFAVAKQGGEK